MPAVSPYDCSSAEIEHDLSITDHEGDLNLISARNTSLLEGKNDSHGGTVGVGIGVGSGGWGISVSASANKGKGSESGNSTTHSETTVDAGNNLILNSGRDTTLTGAQVSGDTVIADIGRNLTLTSEQDSDRYDSRQQNASAGGSFTFGSMSGSASVNLSKDKMHSNYDSVVEQTGIFAGKGGYDITVGEHTRLDGAVIGSTATADKNRLDTGTLGWGDIDNRADFKTEHQSVGFSSGGSIGSQFAGNMANGLLTGENNEGHDSSTTHAAVSDGTLIVRNPGQQTQDTATLSHDVEHANQTLSPIFDKEKEQQRLQQTQLIGEIGNQVADIARTEGQISAINAGKAELAKKGITEPEKGASKEAWERYNAQLAATDGYKAAQQQWGTGSSVQQAIQAATAAVQGLAGSDLKAALAGGAAPYVAEVIGHYSNLDDAGKVAAHAVVNAALAAAQNQSALAGAAGAATAEIVGIIATQMYGKPVSELDETQKQTILTLATLAAGLAGGLTGGSTADTVTAAQAGKTTVKNNALTAGSDLGFWLGKTPDCDTTCKANIAEGVAKGNLIVAAGEVTIVAATAEVAVLARTALAGCKLAPIVCLNDAGIATAEALVPGGVGAGGAIGIGKTASEAAAAKAEAMAANAVKNSGNGTAINSIKNTVETQSSVEQKLANYLLDKQHPVGGSKAEWFDSALGFNKTNSSELSKQIIFDPAKAVKTTETQFGTKYDQVIPITGTNGRTINVKFDWIKNNDGVVRLVTAIPAKK